MDQQLAWDIKFADLLNSGRPALIQAIGFVRGERNRWPELQQLAMGNDETLSHAGVWPRFTVGDDLSGQGHDRIFLPDGRGNFHDVWPALELDDATISRGIAIGDVYGDGRLAVIIARQWAPSLFLRNISSDVGQAIVIDLRVPGAVAGTERRSARKHASGCRTGKSSPPWSMAVQAIAASALQSILDLVRSRPHRPLTFKSPGATRRECTTGQLH